jgi:hypothetical protein
MTKFIAVQEPTCTWAVLDTFDDVPAEVGGRVLIGLAREEAMALAYLANGGRTPAIGDGRIPGTHLRLVVAKAA